MVILRWSSITLDDGFLRYAYRQHQKKVSKFIVRICAKTECRFCMIKTVISLSFSHTECKCIFLKHKKKDTVGLFPEKFNIRELFVHFYQCVKM